MNIYERKFRWKILLLLIALVIAGLTLWYTNDLAKKIAIEEERKIEIWAKAQSLVANLDTESESFQFVQEIITGNNTIPVIMVDERGIITGSRNFDSLKVCRGWASNDTLKVEANNLFLKDQLGEIEKQSSKAIEINTVIEIPVENNEVYEHELKQTYYYKDSTLLAQLKYYPFIQLATIGIFLMLSYLAFSAARRSEQNQVWVGMAKETAHQLGTPLSSIIGWVEYLRAKEENGTSKIADELEKDVQRLNLITNRFSKIGSQPKLEPVNLYNELKKTMQYVQKRASTKITFDLESATNHDDVKISPPLFDWVVENILKNALDAMDGKGEVSVDIHKNGKYTIVDLYNSGKPLPKSKWKTIFQPGYSTKKRGWGLGLSLSKRIIEQYHKGKIFVNSSHGKRGTTFRIMLPN